MKNHETRLFGRLVFLLALASLGKLHGVSVTVGPRRYIGRNGAEDNLYLTWNTHEDMAPDATTIAVLDSYICENRIHHVEIPRSTWALAVQGAQSAADGTRYACFFCNSPVPGVPGPHHDCQRRANARMRAAECRANATLPVNEQFRPGPLTVPCSNCGAAAGVPCQLPSVAEHAPPISDISIKCPSCGAAAGTPCRPGCDDLPRGEC